MTKGRKPRIPDSNKLHSEIAETFTEWLGDGKPMMFALEHLYTEQSLDGRGVEALKGMLVVVIFDSEDLRLLLRKVFESAGGTHEDWDEYDRVMASEERVVVLVSPERILGNY